MAPVSYDNGTVLLIRSSRFLKYTLLKSAIYRHLVMRDFRGKYVQMRYVKGQQSQSNFANIVLLQQGLELVLEDAILL